MQKIESYHQIMLNHMVQLGDLMNRVQKDMEKMIEDQNKEAVEKKEEIINQTENNQEDLKSTTQDVPTPPQNGNPRNGKEVLQNEGHEEVLEADMIVNNLRNCKICNKVFKKVSALKKHVRLKHK